MHRFSKEILFTVCFSFQTCDKMRIILLGVDFKIIYKINNICFDVVARRLFVIYLISDDMQNIRKRNSK